MQHLYRLWNLKGYRTSNLPFQGPNIGYFSFDNWYCLHLPLYRQIFINSAHLKMNSMHGNIAAIYTPNFRFSLISQWTIVFMQHNMYCIKMQHIIYNDFDHCIKMQTPTTERWSQLHLNATTIFKFEFPNVFSYFLYCFYATWWYQIAL